MAYELLFGKRPFRGKTNSSLTTAILKEHMKFPDNAEGTVSAECLDCLRGVRLLLDASRTGADAGREDSCFNEMSRSG